MQLGRFPSERVAELRPWRCHVLQVGVGEVIAREMIAATIDRYLIRFPDRPALQLVEARRVRPITDQVVAFSRPAVRP